MSSPDPEQAAAIIAAAARALNEAIRHAAKAGVEVRLNLYWQDLQSDFSADEGVVPAVEVRIARRDA
jgi:hypothetical protein